VQVHHAEVSPGATQLLASIKALSPDSISWSNIADFMQPEVRTPLTGKAGTETAV
jgi:hypothetical protein